MAKQADNTQIKEITAQIEKGIQELFESEKYRQYLSTMSRFHSYSFRNTMLIHLQRPNATMVAGYNQWEKSFGRHVKKGEKGIKIFAPAPYMKKIQTQKIDPDTHLPVLDAEGKPVTEEKSIKMPRFKVVSVFDISQTYGKPLPQLSSQLTGNVENFEIFMEALRRTSPVPMEVMPIAENMDGYFNIDEQRISIQEGMGEVQTVCAAIHEIGHAKLHNYSRQAVLNGEVENAKDRLTEEVEAESISYTVCQYFGVETGENSFGYIAEWSSGKELKELKASLETINKTASELIMGIEGHFREICQERGIDLTQVPELSQESSPEIPTKKEIASLARDIDQLFLDYYTFSHLQEYPDRKAARKSLREELADPSASAFLSELQNIAGDVDSDSAPKAAALVERLIDYLNRMFPDWKEPPNPPLQSEPLKIDYAPPVTEGLFLLDDNLYVHINLESSGKWDISAYDKESFALMGCCTLADKPNMSMAEVIGTSFKNLEISYEYISVVSMKDRPAIYEQIQKSSDVNNLRRYLGVFAKQDIPNNREHEQNATDEMYLLNGEICMHIHRNDKGQWDFDFYDKNTLEKQPGGTLNEPNYPISATAKIIAANLGWTSFDVQTIPHDLAQSIIEQANASSEKTASTTTIHQETPREMEQQEVPPLPDAPYYDNTVPDPLVSQDFMREYGYKDMDILPMSQDRARELFAYDVSLYMLYFTGTEDMVLSEWDIEHHDALFGISQDDWDFIKDKVPHRDVEQRFLNCEHDAFAIYQLRPEALAELAGASFETLTQPPSRENYKAVYVHGLNPGEDALNNLYSISDRITTGAFEDFTGNNHNTGDIIALKQGGIVSYHYCDYGDHDCFKELRNFQKPENHLRAAEMSTEDDYGMIDGIINNGKQPTVAELEQQAKSGTPISLMDLAAAVHREKKQSVLEQLKPTTPKSPAKGKHKSKSEREI